MSIGSPQGERSTSVPKIKKSGSKGMHGSRGSLKIKGEGSGPGAQGQRGGFDKGASKINGKK